MATPVLRWRFVDPAVPEEWTVLLNPNQMSSIFPQKTIDISATTAVDGQPLVSEGAAKPVSWTFQGVILEAEHYDGFVKWYAKRKRVYLFDHYGRRLTIYMVAFDPTPRRSGAYPFRHDYQVTAIIYGVLAADGVSIIQGRP